MSCFIIIAVCYSIRSLNSLEVLDVSENIFIGTLPEWICELTSLKVLNVQLCGLSELPDR